MRHWSLRLAYGLNQKEQTTLIDKFGGLPWGLPTELWPICAECGRPMQFLAQLQHSPPMLDFGEGQVLHAFLCNFNSICAAYDTDSGANAVFLLDGSQLGAGLTDYPAHLVDAEQIHGQYTAFLEMRLTGWQPFDDALTEDQIPLFYDYSSFWAMDDEAAFPGDFDLLQANKAGPFPYWTGNGPSPRLAKTRIFLQITGDMMPVDDIPPAEEAIRAAPGVSWLWEGRVMVPGFGQSFECEESLCNWANFCSDGTGFFFRENTPAGTRYGLEILR